MDAGWLETYDRYYDTKVHKIFDSVFKQLKEHKHYTYTVGDMAFFRRWYTGLDNDEDRAKVKKLVASGQIEIVHGGLVSTDEATTNYSDILRNFEVAHDFLKQEFGVVPKVGWQLDPFGHSAANAELFAQMGMEAMFFARINGPEKDERKAKQDMEFIWTPEF